MKRRILLAVILWGAVVIGAWGQAAAATKPGDYIVPGNRISASEQANAARALAATGVSPDEAAAIMTGSSDGTFMDGASQAMATDTATGRNLGKAFGASGRAAAASLRIANGGTAVGSSDAATATVDAIAGRGGPIQGRMGVTIGERRSLGEKLGADGAMASAILNGEYMNRVWASPFYTYQDMDRKDGYAGYEYRAWGGSLGYDRGFGPVTAGAAFTYGRGDYEERGMVDDNTIDTYAATLYATYYDFCRNFFLGLAGGFAYGKNDMNQYDPVNGAWQRGRNHTTTYWLHGTVGMDVTVSESFVLTPTVGLFWSEATGSRYRAGGVYDMTVGRMENRGLILPVDLTAAYTVAAGENATLTFRATGGYAFNFRNDGVRGDLRYNHPGALPVVIQGVKPGRHGWNAGAGVHYAADRFDLDIDYRYEGKRKYAGHRVSATIGVLF